MTSLTVDEQSVGGASGERSCAIGSVQGDGAVFVKLKRPPSLVNQVVMLGAERDEIVEIGAAAALPRDDVVNLASAESGLAVRVSAGAVERGKGPSLSSGGDPGGATDVQHLA